jgi:hypothetical protein
MNLTFISDSLFDAIQVIDLLDNSDIELSDEDTVESELDSDYNPDDESDDNHSDDADQVECADDGVSSGDDEIDDVQDDEPQPSTFCGRGQGNRERPRGRRGIGGRGSGRSKAPTRESTMDWSQRRNIAPHRNDADPQQQPVADNNARNSWTPVEYFAQYIDNDVYKMIADATNQSSVINDGHSIRTTPEEIRKFIAINIMMGSLKYPRICMYWTKSTRVAAIKQAMKRDCFFKLRFHIKVIVDINVTDDEKQRDKLWKVHPLLEKVRQACLKCQGRPPAALTNR